MQVEIKKGRVLRSSNRTRGDQDGERKGERDIGLANLKRDQG